MDIIIEGNRILSVERHRADLHTGEVIDATALTVMPGLIEMHSHQRKDYGERLGRIWLAYGITTVRNPAGSPYGSTEDREAYESGARPGPRMFMTGYTFDGSRIYYAGSMGIEAGPEIDLELDRARRLGYDLIKTYVRLPDILQKRIVEFAHRNGMTVTSHELYPAVAFGADGVEHIGGTSRRGYSPKVTRLNHSYSDVIDLLVQSKMTITPTTNIMGGFALAVEQDPALLDDPRFRALFPASVVQATRANTERALASDRVTRVAAFKPLGDTLVRLSRAGGRIIAGTDSPINPYAVTLHAELANYVAGGLTPFQALPTATVNAAEALGAAADLGTIEPGKLAASSPWMVIPWKTFVRLAKSESPFATAKSFHNALWFQDNEYGLPRHVAARYAFHEGVTYTALTMGLAFSDVAATCRRRIAPLALCVVSFCLVSIGAQDRLRSMPGYDQSQKMQAALQGGAAFVSGSITPSWAPDAQSFTYTHAGKTYRFEIATLTSTETAATQPGRGGGRGGPGAEAGNGIGRGTGGRGAQTAAQTEMPAEPVAGLPPYERVQRPAVGLRDVAGRQTESLLSRPEFLDRQRGWHERKANHHRRPTCRSHEVRYGQLGLRRRTGPDHRDVVVARQHARWGFTFSTRAR